MATRRRYNRCVICKRHRDEAGTISSRGKCETCATERTVRNALEINAHRGPFFDNWRLRTILAFGGRLVDEDPLNR